MTTTPDKALYRLMTWLSPAYPVGAYTYSHGLEQAFEMGLVTTPKSTQLWIADILCHGGGFADAVFLCEAYRAANDPSALARVAAHALAYAPTTELALESESQGAAFIAVTEAAWPEARLERLTKQADDPHAYAVAVGVAAEGAGIALEDTLHAYLHAFACNLVSAAVRLIPLGQTDGQRITAALEKSVNHTAERAISETIDTLATCAFMADISSMKHETQYTRLFRS